MADSRSDLDALWTARQVAGGKGESVPYYRDWTFMRSITEGYTRGDTSHVEGFRSS